MPKALKPEKCLKKFFDSKIKANQDRWNAGLENKYFEWQDFRDKVEVALEQSERNSGMLYAINQENAKLKNRNEVLERENERLRQVEKDYQALQKEYSYLMGEPNDDGDDWEL
jgi:hypothetical protein